VKFNDQATGPQTVKAGRARSGRRRPRPILTVRSNLTRFGSTCCISLCRP
jgi:hypothetical protein